MPHKNITAKKYRQHKHHYKPAQHGGAYSVLTETPETLVVIDNLYDSLYIFDKSSGNNNTNTHCPFIHLPALKHLYLPIPPNT